MEDKEEKIHEVSWSLTNHKPDFREQQVRGELVLPSVVPKGYEGKLVCVPVTLDLHGESDDPDHALTIMRDSCSTNILKAKLVIKNKSDVLAWVEPITGNLQDYLVSKRLGIADYTRTISKITLPTPNLLSVTSQVLKGLEDLWKSGNYHGGFTLEKTYYVMDQSGVSIKLCNFKKKKEGTFQKKLAEDCWAFKDELVKIRTVADVLKKRYPHIDCCQLDGVIEALRNIAPSNAESALEIIKRQPFFWGKVERKEFFINDIPLALGNPSFCSKVAKAEDFISLPWGTDDNIKGLLDAMNKYRSTHKLKDYDTNKRVEYVRFVSGLYAHEHQLETNLNVDLTLQEKDPGLCYHLHALIPRGNTVGT